MKRTTAFILTALLLLSLAGCATGTMLNTTGSTPILAVPSSSTIPSTTVPATSIPIPTTGTTSTTVSTAPTQRPSRFYGEQLTVYIEGNPYIYIRYAPGTGSLTRKDCLDHFYTTTHIEGISWNVYSTEEYPDLSFILVMSGTNSDWTYRLADVTGFSAYLDTMGFTPGMSQRNLFTLAESLMYEGKNIKEAAPGYFYDGQYGGGYRSQGNRFGFANDYTRSKDGASAISYNNLYTHVPLEGMALPYGITFDDNLTILLQKAGFDIDYREDFISDETTPGVMTLFQDKSIHLTLTNYSLTTDKNDEYSYQIVYTEVYETPLTDGRVATATRTVNMAFTGTEDTVGFVSLRIQMQYPLNQD